jgi:hypothetical protein
MSKWVHPAKLHVGVPKNRCTTHPLEGGVKQGLLGFYDDDVQGGMGLVDEHAGLILGNYLASHPSFPGTMSLLQGCQAALLEQDTQDPRGSAGVKGAGPQHWCC